MTSDAFENVNKQMKLYKFHLPPKDELECLGYGYIIFLMTQ